MAGWMLFQPAFILEHMESTVEIAADHKKIALENWTILWEFFVRHKT